MRYLFLVLAGMGLALFLSTRSRSVQAQQATAAAEKANAGQKEKALSADLDLVPGDAVGFVHVRLAEIWKHESMAQYRTIFEKAGTKALESLNTQFTPSISSIDRVTAVMFLDKSKLGNSPDQGISGAAIVQFTAAIDPLKVISAHMRNAAVKKVGDKEYFLNKEKPGIALGFVGDRILIVGDEYSVKAVMSKKASGPLTSGIQIAAGKHLYAAVNIAALPIPPQALDQIPDDFKPLAEAKLLTLGMEYTNESKMELRIKYSGEEAAAAAQKSLKKLASLARVFLNQQRGVVEQQINKGPNDGTRPLEELPQVAAMVGALGMINTVDEMLAKPPIELEKSDLVLNVNLPMGITQHVGFTSVAAGLLLPAVQKVREAAARSQSMNNLKQIALAMHNYESAYGTFPPAAICDKKGKKLLSWRVALLPFIEQQALYGQFKLDEPWDSEHNKKLSQIVIKVYTDPRAQAPNGHTYYKAFVGGGALLDWVKGTRFVEITDGLSNTFMVAAGGDPVPWTKPDDFEFDLKKPLPRLATPFGGLLLAAIADGSVRAINEADIRKDNDKIFNLLIQKADGQVIPQQ